MKISLMGMGTGGGPDPLGQKSGVPEREIHALLHWALALGINYFDTSPTYLESEVILGRALKAVPREKYFLSTKIALATNAPAEPLAAMRADEIEPTVDLSLRRLQVSHVDLMLMAVGGEQHFDLVMNEHLPALQRLQRKGKIRFLGSSELSRSDGSHEWLQRILPTGVLDVAMVAHNMINQSAQSSIFPLCRRLSIGVINIFTVRRVFGISGRLEEVLADLKQRAVIAADAVPDHDPLGWLRREGEADSIIEAAYRFAAYTEGVTTVMNGANEIRMLEENVRNVQKGPLSPAAIARLKTIFGQVTEVIGN